MEAFAETDLFRGGVGIPLILKYPQFVTEPEKTLPDLDNDFLLMLLPVEITVRHVMPFTAELQRHLAIRKDVITCRHLDAIKRKGDRVIDIDTADRIDDLDQS